MPLLAPVAFRKIRSLENNSIYKKGLCVSLSLDHDGVEIVLQQLTEIIKEKERQKYIQYQIAKHLAPLDWQTKKRNAEILWEESQEYLTSMTPECSPAQWAESIPQFIFMQSATNHILNQLFSSKNSFS